MSLADLALGRPLSTDEDDVERVGPLRGVGILGLDALASASYGPEALLTALLPLGAGAAGHLIALTFVIIGLLVLLVASYCQTIGAYPGGGGAYTVTRENIGTRTALVAAAALSLDYVLNVAVAISAGVGALVSVVPALLPHTLAACLACLALLTWINLRGVRSTGVAVLLPTYLFVACLFALIVWGLLGWGGAAPQAHHVSHAGSSLVTSTPGGWVVAWISLKGWLLRRGYGCWPGCPPCSW